MKNIILFVLGVFILIFVGKIYVFAANNLKNYNHNEVFVVSNKWHSGFVIPSKEIFIKLPALEERFKNNAYIEFGWGDEDFYQSGEFSIGTSISAIFWPTDSVIHSVAIPKKVERYFLNREIEKICLNDKNFDLLIKYISKSFYKDKGGNIVMLKKGLYGDSQFYKGVGEFHLFNTCNKWTANGLKSIGLEIWTKDKLTAKSVLNFLKNVKKDKTLKLNIECYQ